MKNKNVVVVLHVYKGRDGHRLAHMYFSEFLRLLQSKKLDISVYVFCYGFTREEENFVKSLFQTIDGRVIKFSFEFQKLVYSEVPTLREIIKLSKIYNPDDLMIYFHSKGASYSDQNYYINWGLYASATLAAALDHIAENSMLIDRYHSIGPFAGLGVFDRFGTLTPAYSGNFWLTKVKNFYQKDLTKKWYSDAFHNRHHAEALLGLDAHANLLLNLEDNYNFRAVDLPDLQKIYDKIKIELGILSTTKSDQLAFVDSYIKSFYDHLIVQQKRYSEKRIFWKFRRFIFGNKSILRYSSFFSKALDRLVPWSQCELYRHYSGPKQFSVLNDCIATSTYINER